MIRYSYQTETWTMEESQVQAFEFEIGIRNLLGWIINLFD